VRIDRPRPRATARPSLVAIVVAAMTAVLLLGLTTSVAAGATTQSPKCDYVNLRKGPSLSYARKTSLRLGDLVTVVGTVRGGYYSTTCGGAVAGRYWRKITAINGRSVKSLYGITYVYGASKLFTRVASVTPSPSPTDVLAAPTSAPTADPSPDPSVDPSSTPSAPPSSDPSPSADPSASPLPDGVTPLGDTVEFFGRGYGHGVGMSQYGADGRAAAGQDAATILGHYYPGTTLGTMANATIRVRILSGFEASATNPLRLYGRGGSWTIDGVNGSFPADAQLKVFPDASTSTGWRITVTAADGTSLLNRGAPTMKFYVRPAGSASALQLYSKPSTYDRYRGTLRVICRTDGTARVVNTLSMEDYLRGAVPAEMPASWPAEALKVQAIAARSYAAYRLHPDSGGFDVYDDTRSQVYRGLLAERSSTDAAVAATAGQVVKTSGGSVANTLYHSADGGATENNENVFVSSSGAIVAGKVSYLRGSSDRTPDGSSYDSASPYATWHTATYTLEEIQAAFAGDSRTNVGTLVGLDLRDRGVSGRLISVTLYGADGTTKTVSGAVFLSVFNAETPPGDPAMRNTLFDLVPIP
jgi:SpoIID/LytB domain protein